MRTVLALAISGLFLAACGGGNDQLPPPPPPPPPPMATAAPPPPPVVDAAPPEAPKPSLAELQKGALKGAVDALNAHDAKAFASAYADDALITVAGLNDVSGRDKIAANMQEWFDTFSKIKLGWSRVWAKNDVMILEWVLNGTYSGDLFGVKGNDQPIGHTGVSVLFFDKDGKVKNEHRYGDLGTVMEQVGKGKTKPPIPQIPEKPEWNASTGAADEDAKVDVAKAVYAALEKKSEADYLAKLADDVEYEGHLGKVSGKADAKKFFATLTKGFPDMKFDVTNAWGVGDYAIVEYTLTGTNKAPLMGLGTATGRKVIVHAVDVMKTKDGKVQKAQTYSNGLELMMQLGAFQVGQAPGAAKPAAPAAPAAPATPKK